MSFDDSEISRMLESALSSYTPDEPLGLPLRVRMRMADRARSRRRSRLLFSVFACASLCLVGFLLTVFQPPSHLPPMRRTARTVQQHHEVVQFALPSAAPIRKVHRRVCRSLPRLAQFPAPTPLTADERALLKLSSVARAQLFAKREIEIKPLQINPL